jgi:hypothetical protein
MPIYHRPLTDGTVSLNAAAPVVADPAPRPARDGVRGNNPLGTDLLVKIMERGLADLSAAAIRGGRWTYRVPPGGSWEDGCGPGSKVLLIAAAAVAGDVAFEELG